MERPAVPGAGAVRDEDAFDVAAVAAWLRAQDPGADVAGRLEGDPEVRQFSGGASNLTYLLRFPDRDLILRRPPAGQKARGAHDMSREFTIQARLKPAFPYVPKMVALCGDEGVIGSEFYVMERLDGTILGRDLPPGMDLPPADVRRMCTGVLDRLVGLHSVDAQAAGLGDLGGALAYWVQADDDEVFAQFRRQPTHLPGMLTRAEVVDYYTERTGLSVSPDQWRFYAVQYLDHRCRELMQ